MLTTRPLSASAPLTDPAGNVLSNVTITFTLVDASMRPTSVWDAVSGDLVVGAPSVTTDVNGLFSLSLWPTQRGNVQCQYLCKINYAGIAPFTFSISDLATPLSWVDAMASGLPFSAQQLAFYDGIVSQAQASANAAAAAAVAASGSESAALNSENLAATQAQIATNQAAAAQGYANNAAVDAGNASGSATTAQSALASLQAALAAFSTIYLGKKSADPTLDNAGNPLIVGAEYFNTSSNLLRIYTASGWQNYDFQAQADTTNAALSALNAASAAAAALTSAQNAASSAFAAQLAAAHALVPSQSLKADYTIQATDMGSIIMFTGPLTVTFPAPSSTFASAVPVFVANINILAVTIAGLPTSLGISSIAYGEVIALLCDGNTWYLLGSDPSLRVDILKGFGGSSPFVLTTDSTFNSLKAPAAQNQIVPLPNSSFYLTGSAIVRQAGSSTQNQLASAIDFWCAGYIGATPGSIVVTASGASNKSATTGWTIAMTPDLVNGAVQIAFSSGGGLTSNTTAMATCSTRMAQ